MRNTQTETKFFTVASICRLRQTQTSGIVTGSYSEKFQPTQPDIIRQLHGAVDNNGSLITKSSFGANRRLLRSTSLTEEKLGVEAWFYH